MGFKSEIEAKNSGESGPSGSGQGACTALVVFGITGDLARKKTFGALFELWASGDSPIDVVGVGRSEWTNETLRNNARKAISETPKFLESKGALSARDSYVDQFLEHLTFVQGDYSTGSLYAQLSTSLRSHGSVLCYLAVPPTVFPDIVKGLAGTDLRRSARLLVEKPFGTNLASSIELAAQIGANFEENRVYAVDHFLAKESLQNISILRFANRVFEPCWNSQHIESVTVTFAEDLGIEGRAGFFDSNGTVRDVVQNHVLQVVAALAMEPPTSPSADHLNDRRRDLLDAIVPVALRDTTFGQYNGYLDTEGVRANSTTETFVRTKLEVNNERWRGCDWTIVAGKAMAESRTEIDISFRAATHVTSIVGVSCDPEPNRLTIRLSPDESVTLSIQSRTESVPIGTAATALISTSSYRPSEERSAYARLFDDARRGDHTNFVRHDVVATSWRIVEGLLDHNVVPVVYEQGTWGPPAQGQEAAD